MLYIFELYIIELIIYLSVILSSDYCNLYPAMLYFCIIKSYQKAGYYIMRLKALKAAFPSTLPIFTGFWVLGLAYGIYEGVGIFFYLSNQCL